MAGGGHYRASKTLEERVSELEFEEMKRKAREEINQATKESEMANPNEGGMNRHKKLAMGEKIELKGGGMPKKKSKAKPKKK